MKIAEGRLQFTRQEFKELQELFEHLKRFGSQSDVDELTKILSDHSKDRSFTLSEWNKYRQWRRPKGTAANSYYMLILERYWALGRCQYCRGLGYTGSGAGSVGCKECGSTGVSPEYRREFLDKQGEGGSQ